MVQVFYPTETLLDVYKLLMVANMNNQEDGDLKDDIVVIQFKSAESTVSFVNVPELLKQDKNLKVLFEIVANKKNVAYVPYNKSILTKTLQE